MNCTSAYQAIGEGLQRNTVLKELVLNSSEIGESCPHRLRHGVILFLAGNCICCPLSFTLLTFCLAGLGTSTPGQPSAQSPPYAAEQTWGPGLQGEKITAMCKTAPHTIGCFFLLESLDRPWIGKVEP